jgi:hypothetical protein
MKQLKTWAGRSTFRYSGSVSQGTIIEYGDGFRFSIKVSEDHYRKLRAAFLSKTVPIGTSRTDPTPRSIGEWLKHNVTNTGIASYVGPILISEEYAKQVGQSEIKIIK